MLETAARPKRLTKDARHDRWERILQALHPNQEVWEAHAWPPYTCEDLCTVLERYVSPDGEPIKITQSNMHRTLKQMVAAGFVTRERDKQSRRSPLAKGYLDRVCVVYWRTHTIKADKLELNLYLVEKNKRAVDQTSPIKQYL